MKQYLFVFYFLAVQFSLVSQSVQIPDTLLFQTFTEDPSDTFLIFPSGNDNQWVNWDADNLATVCGDNSEVPGAWYWESDLGDLSDPPVNFAFTSCSFLVDPNQHNENWLITPPIFIPDAATALHWKSMPFEGPGYMDGYKVLLSTGSNEPFTGAFSDTLFVAAEMEDFLVPQSLDPNDYIFSPGYVHADRYTDTSYFFLITPSAGAYTGRLEPHTLSLAAYAGQSIYIAFLHDSTDDSVLQIDDITVVHGESTSTKTPSIKQYTLSVQPNPGSEQVLVQWTIPTQQEGLLRLTDLLGQTVLEQKTGPLNKGSIVLHIGHLPSGIYPCTLMTTAGQQTTMLVKQ